MRAESLVGRGDNGLRARLMNLLARPEIRGMAAVIAVKVMMVALNFTLIALAARALDTVGFGYYSILFSAAGLLLIVGAAGQELFVIRSWNEFAGTGDAARAKGALRFTATLCLIASAIVAALFYPWTAASFGPATALAVTAFLFLSAMLQVSNHLLRTAASVAAGDGIGNLFQLAPAIAYLAASLATGAQATVAGAFAFMAGGAAAGLATHLVIAARLLHRRLPDWRQARPIFHTREWLARSGRLWGANTLEATNQYVDVLIIGLLTSPAIAGAYFVTVRLANLFAAAADAINLFATRHFSRLYHADDHSELHGFLDTVAWITIAFIGAGLVSIAAGGYFALLIINPAYTVYFPELLVLCVGTAALAIARPSGSILMLTGAEGRYLWVVAASVVLRVGLLFALVPAFGVMGAVAATALVFLLTATALRHLAIASTGFDPTLLRLTQRKPAN